MLLCNLVVTGGSGSAGRLSVVTMSSSDSIIPSFAIATPKRVEVSLVPV